MQQREAHLTTAYIALICSALGWVSWGVIAIPGVIIAHTVKSVEPSTGVAVKASLRVGYAAILVGLAKFFILVLTYFGVISRLNVALGIENTSQLNGYPYRGTAMNSEDLSRLITNWTWIGVFLLVTLLVLILILPLLRKGYASLQSARILRNNTTR